MLPLPMNEYVQENLNAVGFDATFEVMEWNALVTFAFQPVTGDNAEEGRRERHQHQPRHGRSLFGLHAPDEQQLRAAGRRQLGRPEGREARCR